MTWALGFAMLWVHGSHRTTHVAEPKDRQSSKLAMRPNHLNLFFGSLQSIKGVGPKMAQNFAKLLRGDIALDARRIDLLLHMPHSLIDRSLQMDLNGAPEGVIVTVKVVVDKHIPPPRGNRRVPYRILCHDETASLTLTFFHVKGGYLERQMPVGEIRHISGRLEQYGGELQMTHPDHMVSEDDFASMPLIEPVYPLTAGLSGKVVHKVVRTCLEEMPPLAEWQDGAFLSQQHWPSFGEALELIHNPLQAIDLEPTSPAMMRLAYDECLASQLALSLVRQSVKKQKGVARQWRGMLKARLIAALPFTLTAASLMPFPI